MVFDRTMPFIFCDSASQGILGRSGVGGYIIFKSFQMTYQRGIKKKAHNYVELMSLITILTLALENGISIFNIFSNSLLVVNWLMEEARQINTRLQPLLRRGINMKLRFTFIKIMQLHKILYYTYYYCFPSLPQMLYLRLGMSLM